MATWNFIVCKIIERGGSITVVNCNRMNGMGTALLWDEANVG
ncbi:hypothetical protein TOT_020000537 [Theileria orientalis strain Shintoku]|uniref:Uncharacterized protein n=1 Tax=Theileria orientalis strain Shintoku TaxID=869250 RepID=J4CD00_THEOR|nr:hypothetical protein TOT_020000537 [Theileria orientalis strain Shintoku]PVC51599.1 hypothetical protein MACL_00001416 [Theileria orientalis]BAM40277.1 hypothetical protein TOT_020000537 [Theileria orientalis strain Shintoku]|eukprot:XP_009690578.1 hypothetical protein TOT_020000537 [Theileria orientalis strain Shintoku]